VYQIGNITIVLNTILCFIATKRGWARMVLCDHIKKLYSPEEINQAHNIILHISESRKPRNTTRDTKRMTMVIVHTMMDQCLNNNKLVFATTTTNIPTTDWSPPKKSTPFVKFFHKTSHQGTQTHNEPAMINQDIIENKIDLLIGMFCDQQSTINKLLGQEVMPTQKQECGEEASLAADSPSLQTPSSLPSLAHDQSSYEPFPFASPPPVRGDVSYTATPQNHEHSHNLPPHTTSTPVPDTPSPPSPPAPSQPTHDLAAEPAPPRPAPRPAPRKHFPNNAEASVPRMRSEASTQVTPRRSYIKNSKRKNKEKNLPPNRQWDDATHHQVPGVPAPSTTPSPPQVPTVVVNIAERPEAKQTNEQDKDGFITVTSRKGKRRAREERQTSKPLQGVERPQVVYLYITSCHPDTEEEDIEDFLTQEFENISNAKAYKTNMTHHYYSSFTVTIRGKDIHPELFTDSDVFPKNVKVFLNKNKYKSDQLV